MTDGMLTFVEKEFYCRPPEKDADPKEWEEWLLKEKRKRAAHKAAFTRSLKHEEMPEEMQQTTQRKIGGVWRQVTPVGFNGSAEDGDLTLEPTQDAQQNKLHVLKAWSQQGTKRGTRSKGRHARRRRNKKRRK